MRLKITHLNIAATFPEVKSRLTQWGLRAYNKQHRQYFSSDIVLR